LRKLIIIGTALAVLGLAAVAYAATGVNTYTASFGFSPTTAGTANKPVNVGFTQTYGAKGTKGNRAAPLKDIKLWIYGLQSNGKDFPTCNAKKIALAKSDSLCPKGALIASGPVNSLLGAASQPKSPGTPCNLFLHVWNGGQGKQIFFFVIIPPKYTCGGLTTGAAAPYTATIKQVGKFMLQDTPLPPDVSTKAGNLKGVYGSLIAERLTWKNLTTKVKGKTVGYNQSTACQGKLRPWKIQFTALGYNGKTSVQTLTGSSKCS
jgi:hypothetical protein